MVGATMLCFPVFKETFSHMSGVKNKYVLNMFVYNSQSPYSSKENMCYQVFVSPSQLQDIIQSGTPNRISTWLRAKAFHRVSSQTQVLWILGRVIGLISSFVSNKSYQVVLDHALK